MLLREANVNDAFVKIVNGEFKFSHTSTTTNHPDEFNVVNSEMTVSQASQEPA